MSKYDALWHGQVDQAELETFDGVPSGKYTKGLGQVK